MKSDSTEAFEALKVYMKENHNAKIVAGGREILKRCHFCGDSRNMSDAHLYIGLKNGAIVYNCFKCNSKGVVDGKFLRDIGCYDLGLLNLCIEQNKKNSSSGSLNSKAFRNPSKFYRPIIPISNNAYAIKKLKYVSNRFGYEITPQIAANFKIVVNIKDFLSINGIERYTRDPSVVDLLDKFFVGFLSMDNRYIVMRRLVPEGKLPQYIDTRYVNYDIFGIDNEGMKFYTIPSTFVDPFKPVEIHIAEGCFDILSIYFHVAPFGTNGVFSAVNGKSYSSLVRYLIMTYGFTAFDLHLYPDADVNDRKMEAIHRDIEPFGVNTFIHRNMFPGEKDFGVPLDHVNDKWRKI